MQHHAASRRRYVCTLSEMMRSLLDPPAAAKRPLQRADVEGT
jgi:hypothetical protein